MKNTLWNDIRFVRSCAKPPFPIVRNSRGVLLPEVAFVGRSNVGKSSLINDLCGKKIAKTSSTPGKTQLINFFMVEDLSIVDLPGYGYAKVPRHIEATWSETIQNYLEMRKELSLILFLIDIRRTPNAQDLQFVEWAQHYKKPLILVFTKIDKVSRSELETQTRNILSFFQKKALPCLHYSAKTGQGREELFNAIESTLGL